MIELSEPVQAGRAHALFIGRDAPFAADSFQGQYELILGKFSGIRTLAYAEQVHGDRAYEIFQSVSNLHFAGEGDALFSRDQGIALLIRTADCIPILFYSATDALVGAVHAGWRGLEKKILTKALAGARAETKHLRFVIGPFIGGRSYEVDNDVADRFASAFSEPKAGGKFWLSLRKILGAELTALGIASSQVTWHDDDTLSAEDWFSARRGDQRRNLSLIWLSAS